MAASQHDIDVVRLGLEIPEDKEAAFTNDLLAGFIEAHPVKDSTGKKPADLGYSATYDLMAATADLWGLIAASLSSLYDFVADAATFSRSQVFQHALTMARFFRSRSYATSSAITRDRQTDILYQGRWPFMAEFDLQLYESVEQQVYAPNTQQGTPL